MKKILVIYYTQSGQLHDILTNVTASFDASEVQVDYYNIKPVHEFPFPWPKKKFFDAFPESFLQIPQEIEAPPSKILETDYDLIILGYQVWYLSPSIPINSFLKSTYASKVLKDKPVITLIGCRNMWIMAQEKVKKLLHKHNANLVGNIALVDRHINHISVITIVYWMFTGKKTSYKGIFPKPGVSNKDIEAASRFGKPIWEALTTHNFTSLQEKLKKLGAVTVKPFLIVADKRANILFSKWANLIRKKGSMGDSARSKYLVFFNYYLIIAIWIFMPIVFIVFLLTYLPLYPVFKKQKLYYSSTRLNDH